jgi:hypothetical protein
MQWSDIPRHPSRRMLRQFGGLLAVISLGLAVWRGSHDAAWLPLAAVSAGAAAMTLARPEALRLVFVGWLMVAFPIGWVVGRLALALIFFGLFTPAGLILRLVGLDPLRRKRPGGTCWTGRARPESGDYFRQY